MAESVGWARRLTLLRRLWGYGIGGVMIVAVAPYPLRGFWDSTEVIHRIHDTVGSVQYLPLWAVPVLVWAHRRHDLSMWRLALASAVVILVVALCTGDALGSGSWLPLGTMLLLWPVEDRRSAWLVRVDRLALLAAVSAGLLWWVAIVNAPAYLRFQNVSGGDVHGVRYHYGGMAAASFSLAATATVIALGRSSRAAVALVAASVIAVGVAHRVWSEYDSALAPSWSWLTIAAGVLMAPLAFWEWPALQISLRAAAPSPSSSSHPRPTTHS
ncbi:MAG: hypothetical protein F2934_03680 [Actinobacteria bacterium]|nr:hypothetical protein [Actinomycetota bacterium]MSY13785.1 hypothetical protein [Actinomycetota bacterium]MSZ03469.1 hypothetical protein [Actinomycetota bacterium]MTB06215.1 hypothetical protein [Actinomycetota bacterium]